MARYPVGRGSDPGAISVYGSYEDFAANSGCEWQIVADVADALGEEAPVEDLDI